jgi:hypothetical protein
MEAAAVAGKKMAQQHLEAAALEVVRVESVSCQ